MRFSKSNNIHKHTDTLKYKFFQFSENETKQWNMKTNSLEAIVGWMVLIRNLGLSWFLVKEKNLKQNSFKNHKAWKGENKTQQSQCSTGKKF